MATVYMYNSFPESFLEGKIHADNIWATLVRSTNDALAVTDTRWRSYDECDSRIPSSQLLSGVRVERSENIVTLYAKGFQFRKFDEARTDFKMQATYVFLHTLDDAGRISHGICYIPVPWNLYYNKGTISWPDQKVFECELIRS